jgi:hypothetical protein
MPTKPSGKAALAKRQKERADLKAGDVIWIGIAMTEANLQRLGALLLFADFHVEVEKKELGPLPFDGFEADAPPPPQLEINYALVKNDIMAAMQKMIKARGEGPAKELIVAEIRRLGGTRLNDVPQNQLIALYTTLTELNKETTE